MRDAAMFPFYASAALFGLYIVFKVSLSLSQTGLSIIYFVRFPIVPSQGIC